MYLIILVSNLYLWIKLHRWLPSCPWLLNGNLGQQGSWLQTSLRCFISFSLLGGSKVKVEASCCSWWGRRETVYIAVLLWFLHHRVHPFSIFFSFCFPSSISSWFGEASSLVFNLVNQGFISDWLVNNIQGWDLWCEAITNQNCRRPN